MNAAEPLRAPQGAVAWVADTGWLYEPHEPATHVSAGATVIVVSDDGMVRGVTDRDRAPLAAVLRVEGDITEIVQRLDDLGDRLAGIDTGNAADVNMIRARVDGLVHRVTRLEAAR